LGPVPIFPMIIDFEAELNRNVNQNPGTGPVVEAAAVGNIELPECQSTRDGWSNFNSLPYPTMQTGFALTESASMPA
jgi:hypothetical protein